MNSILAGALAIVAKWLSIVPNKTNQAALESRIKTLKKQLEASKAKRRRDAEAYESEINQTKQALEEEIKKQSESAAIELKTTKELHRVEVETVKLENSRLDGELTIAKQFLERQQEIINWHQQTVRAETAYQTLREVNAIGGDVDE